MSTALPPGRYPFYVRSQHQLAAWTAVATGPKISYAEALRLYGDDTLQAVADEGAARIDRYPDEPGASFRRFRQHRRMSLQELADEVQLTVAEVTHAEDNTDSPMRVLVPIATYFGIPPLELSVKKFYPDGRERSS